MALQTCEQCATVSYHKLIHRLKYIEVYWFGVMNCWLDYVMVDDVYAHELFTNAGLQRQLKNLAGALVNDVAFPRTSFSQSRARRSYTLGLIQELFKQAAIERRHKQPINPNLAHQTGACQ